MFDIHYHLIFGVDDGPESIEDSMALAEASIAEGVTHIVATPHANDTYSYRPDVNRERLQMLRERLDGRLTLGLGCDFHLTYENILDLRHNPTRYTVNGKQYLLVEFPDLNIPQSITQAFHEMIAAGIVPILTHPERNPVLMNAPERMVEWIQAGCLLQVTAASLRGRFGATSEAMAWELIKRNWVHIIASDAHSMEGRTPSMGRAHAVLIERTDQGTADRLCIENPRAVFFGEGLNEQPRPIGLGKESHSRRGLFGRVFGK